MESQHISNFKIGDFVILSLSNRYPIDFQVDERKAQIYYIMETETEKEYHVRYDNGLSRVYNQHFMDRKMSIDVIRNRKNKIKGFLDEKL
jgi:hypothetical protein